MKLIIPGAAGFVGVNLLEAIMQDEQLLGRYNKIVLVDVLQYGVQKIPQTVLDNPKFEFIQDSIYNEGVVDKLVEEGDAIIHLAVEENTFNAPQQKTTAGAEAYIEDIASKKPSRFVFISTADIYGINNADDITESAVVTPTILYAANKVAFEAYLQVFVNQAALQAVIFRPVTIYGNNQYPGWLIPRVITRAINGEKIQLTGDGSVRRDWIHVSDVCSAILKAVASDDKLAGEVFNLGSGTEMTVLEVTKHILKRVGQPESLIEFIPDRTGDIPRQITHAKKAQQKLGWKPQVDFLAGLDTTIDWYKKNPQQ
jgi:dTDP-glucose 4,6-dehydratase